MLPHKNLVNEPPSVSPLKKRKTQDEAGPSRLIRESKASTSKSSSFSSTFSTTFAATSSTSDHELSNVDNEMLGGKRRQTTCQLIENNSRFYLGIPKNVFLLIKFMTSVTDLTPRDIFICLKKIRLNDVNFRLALDFGISSSSVQRVITNCIPKIAHIMQNFIFFPTKNQIKKLLPIPFRYRYSNVHFIIDCFEIEIQKPNNPVHQSHSWSEYLL